MYIIGAQHSYYDKGWLLQSTCIYGQKDADIFDWHVYSLAFHISIVQNVL